MSTKRHSIIPAMDRSGPKPPVNFSSSVVISENALLRGTHSITMQSETVVHPHTKIESSLGSILVGRRCIIHERVHVGACPRDNSLAKPGGVTLGDYVIIEAGSVVEAGDTEIGEGCTIQVGSRISSGAKIGKGCTISHMSIVPAGETLADFTTLYSNGLRRKDVRGIDDSRKHAVVKQITALMKMIPSSPEKFQ